MTDVNVLSLTPRAVARAIRSAREADAGRASLLSVEEQIMGAFLTGRLNLLPFGYSHPLDALIQLGITGICTTLHAHQRGWRSEYEATVDARG